MRIIFRCDAGTFYGLGHLSRCLVIAQELKKKNEGVSSFIIKTDNVNYISLFLKERIDIESDVIFLNNDISKNEELKIVIDEFKKFENTFLIVDHYQVDTRYGQYLSNEGVKWLQFDFACEGPFFSDIIVNSNPSANKVEYQNLVNSKCKILAGIQYALIREEIRANQITKQMPVTIRNVLITFGGSNTDKQLDNLIPLIAKVKSFQFYISDLTGLLPVKYKKYQNRHLQFFDGNSMFEEKLAKCDLVITGGGITSFEVAYLKKYMIIICVANNQVKNAIAWEKMNFSTSYLDFENFKKSVSEHGFESLVSTCQRYFNPTIGIDGNGAARIIKEIYNLL